MRDLALHFHELEILGFTIIDDVVTAAEIDVLKTSIRGALIEDAKRFAGRPGKQDFHIVELVNAGPQFLKLLDNNIMHQVFSHFLEDSCILYTYSTTLLPADVNVQTQTIHVDTGRLIPGYCHALQMTLALDDFTADNGATYYLPGSHHSLTQPSVETFDKYAVQTIRKAGAALFWNPRCFHKAGINRTEGTRFAISTYAVRSWMKQRFDYPRMISQEMLEQCSPRLRRFLGVDVRPPANQDEYYDAVEARLSQNQAAG